MFCISSDQRVVVPCPFCLVLTFEIANSPYFLLKMGVLFYIAVPFIALMPMLLVLASFNGSLGFRRKCVQILLIVFEFGRMRIAKERKRMRAKITIQTSVDESESVAPDLLDHSVIRREELHVGPLPRSKSYNSLQKDFGFYDVIEFIKPGVEAIIEDEVTKRFSAEDIPSWNLLTRTNKNYGFFSFRLFVLWFIGWILRYWVFLPIRIFLTVFGVGWLVCCTAVIGCVPEGKLKRWLYWHVSLMCFRILARSFSAIVNYHNRENLAKGGGICVANHTSPIDVVILACDNCYALVGQHQGGFLGLLQRALARATSHVWFERFEVKDRALVTQRLKEHCSDPEKLPILIFPEGTCINNTSVMMFKKGSFEVGGTIYPAAIKYDSRFGDPFWNSSAQGYMHYLLMMMTSWAIVCDVWYLPPMNRMPNESSIDFAKRVKAAIAHQGGLVDLEWDGQLKRMAVKKEWKELQQQEYSRKIKVN